MNTEKHFVDGLVYRGKRDGAPEFVKGSFSIKAKEFVDFLAKNKQFMSDAGWFNIDIKEAKSGKMYCELNTWKKPTTSDGNEMPAF